MHDAVAVSAEDKSCENKQIDYLTNLKMQIENFESICNDPITVNHTSYIAFVLDGFRYYYQVDDNPFFYFYYSKTPVKDGKYSKDACHEEDSKDWLLDCYLKSGCSDEEIKEAAYQIFNMIVSAKNSDIRRDSRRVRVPNTYNSGYHYETVLEKERFGNIDF